MQGNSGIFLVASILVQSSAASKESQSVHLTKIIVPVVVGAIVGVLLVLAVIYFQKCKGCWKVCLH